ANQALEHRNIQGAVVPALPASDPSNLRLVDSEKHRQLGDPLIEERTAMDKDQGVSATLRQEVRCQDRFPQTWRRDEHPDVMLQESLGCALLNRRELAVKSQAQPFADVSLVFHAEDDAVFAEQIFDLLLASARQSKMLGEILGAGDDAWGSRRGQSHHLFLVELGVLEGGDPLD